MSSITDIMRKRKSSTLSEANCYSNQRLIGLMDSIRSIQPPGKWKIIVVDSKSNQILNAACKMYDILEENVSVESQRFWAEVYWQCIQLGDTYVNSTHSAPVSY